MNTIWSLISEKRRRLGDFAATNFMGGRKRSALKLAWVWVIEYVATVQELDPSFLHALIDEAPPELLEDLGEDVTERVSLRCLEHLFGSRNESESDVPSSSMPKYTIDFSRSCDDVLLSILKETSVSDLRTGPDLWKWDMQPFIAHKRITLPKCFLERLKDELLEGVHPWTASLIKHSGLMHKDKAKDQPSTVCFQRNDCCRDDTRTSNSPIAAQDSLLLEKGDSHHENLLPMKRDRNVVDNDDQADYQKDQGDGDLHLNAKRIKCNVSSADEAAEHALSPQFDNEIVEEPLKSMIGTREKESLHGEKESRVEGLDGCMSSENGHEFVATNRIVRSGNADAINEIELNQCDNADDATKTPEHTFEDGHSQDIMAGDANDAETRNGTSSGRILQKVSVDDSRHDSNCGNQQKSPIDVSSSGSPRVFIVENSEDSAERPYEEDASSEGDEIHHEKVDVAMKRSLFLSSQCTLSHDSLSNNTSLNCSGQSSKGGQFFVCSADGCSVMVPKNCLGCSPSFNDKGNFHCPFCAYFCSISQYMEAKAKSASAKKELAPFINKYRGRSLGKKHHNVTQKSRVKESDETNERRDNKKLGKRKVEEKFEEPIISCCEKNLVQREEEQDITHGMSRISPAQKESKGMAQEHVSTSGLDRQDRVSVGSRDQDILINEKEGEGGIQKEVGQQSNDLLEKPVSAVNSDEGKTISEKTKEDTKKQGVSPEKDQSVKKPSRVLWTVEEEQMLKEGVEKFIGTSKNIPWRKILEYGRSVFWSGRTPMHLKDKWRNIERKSK